MSDKKIKKLKRKIWIISTIILSIYLTLLIINPTVWAAFLPIIIPSGSLTIGIPIYNIYKDKEIKKNKKEKTQEYINNIISSNNNIKEDDAIDNYHKELVIEEVDNVSIKLDKPKIKTKGTIH